MIVSRILGTYDESTQKKTIDTVFLEWHECNRRLLHKKTTSGKTITLRFLDGNVSFRNNDIVYEDELSIIILQIQPCKVLVIRPVNLHEMATVCYELGNKHLPLFYEEGILLIPFDKPVFQMLSASGCDIKVEDRILRNPLKTSVLPHAHEGSNQSLFSRILKLSSGEK